MNKLLMWVRNKYYRLIEESNIIKYKVYNRFKKNSGVNKQETNFLIVSLTTFSKRIDIVYLTLESLLNQSLKPDIIILWLSEEDLIEGRIPKKIVRLKSRGLEIRVVKENIKSYKKLIYTIEEFQDYNIITCDDDTIYPNDFLEGLWKTHKKFPKCIVAYRCHIMEKLSHQSFKPYQSWHNSDVKGPSFDLFPTGVGGILYPKNSLNKLVLKKKLFLDLAPLGDDIWFKAMALLNKKKTVMVKDKSIEFQTVKGTQENALWRKNVMEKENDIQLEKVFNYFNLYDY